MRRVKVSAAEARRIAFAAQGFDRARPNAEPDARHFRRIVKLRLSDMPTYAALSIRNLAVMVYISLRIKLFSATWRYFESRSRPIPRVPRRKACTIRA